MKCTDYKGVVSTRTMIRRDYFHNEDYIVGLKDSKDEQNNSVEFCIPPNILLGIIDKVNHF